jgi:hypothetical protein
MLRTLPVIVSAILLSRPTMPRTEAIRYAKAVQHEAETRDFDPFTAVAIIHFESRWKPSAVSPDGEDYGLGQVRARFTSGCRDDADPVSAPSPACLASKAALLIGENNIRRMAAIITANRELCREKVGSAWFPQWLAGYQGMNRPSAQRWCTPSEKTFEVIAYQKKLAAMFAPRPPPIEPKRAPPPSPPQPEAISSTIELLPGAGTAAAWSPRLKKVAARRQENSREAEKGKKATRP